MTRFRTALCAALIALTPMAASAHWYVHHGWRHHSRDYSPSVVWRDPDGWIVTCERHALNTPPGQISRCRAARAAFQRDHPCPATGEPRGACPGYVVDHIVPLKRGGADDPANMQWQTVAEAKAKDRTE
ncbi:MAG TPA: HNH endonuclease signature motif containing protein [Caulobacteraceae bacterium]|nr:HNH endonuclease signature motif containing protein [Caulobacteraceae bacterium]